MKMKALCIFLSVVYLVLINETIAQNCQQHGCPHGLCCSKWGYCGSSAEHCAGGNRNPQPSGGNCNPPCAHGLCCSKWGYCGNTPEHCAGQKQNPTPSPNNNNQLIQQHQFNCIFDRLDSGTRNARWQGLQEALSQVSFKPQNQNELMIFLAHVSHESDGLKTLVEYCAQRGECVNNYQSSWCSPIQGHPGKHYYGRGWFQLSWPCNYYNAGKALGVDLLGNPDQVAHSQKLACATALWFWNANQLAQPAREGNFGATTRIINKIECGGTPEQQARINHYQKVRQCFGLGHETRNLWC